MTGNITFLEARQARHYRRRIEKAQLAIEDALIGMYNVDAAGVPIDVLCRLALQGEKNGKRITPEEAKADFSAGIACAMHLICDGGPDDAA
jgi:hypothetical protein